MTSVLGVGCDGPTNSEPPTASLSESGVGGSDAGILPPTATPTPPANEFAIVGQPERFQLEDLSLVGIEGWINSDPLEIDQLAADKRVVLIDFWTYTCVNCVRTFPYLKAWHDAYSDHGLVIVGVHSPEFDFEKSIENVRSAVDRYDIEYPVANDSEKKTWDKYGNHFWPSKYLISTSGEVVLRHFGEGGYDEFETAIRTELEHAGRDLATVPRTNVIDVRRSEMAHTITRELYGGYSKNYLPDGLFAGQDAYYEAPDAVVDYVDNGTRRHGQFFLDGQWENRESAVVTGSMTEDEHAYVVFDFFATSVNAVMNSEASVVQMIVELDGRPLAESQAGVDVTWGDEGRSLLNVSTARLYQIVELPEFGKHELVLKTDSEGLALYTVTFGVNEFGP
jgi:thiol-disulfide isomerase/thioredoxin